MRIVIDYERCESHGVCMTIAPEIFDIDDNDNLVVDQEAAGPGMRHVVEQAVAGCPRAAISTSMEDGASDGN
jgi:ferredoxin